MMATLDWRQFIDLDEFERAALDVWTPGARAMIQEGAGANGAVVANRAAWQRWALRPRVLVDVSQIDTATTVLGQQVSLPVLVGPSGLHSMSHPDGEVATARGSRTAGTLMVLSAGTSRSMAEVRAAAEDGPTWFQMYWGADRSRTASLTGMAEDAGCTALVVTVDLPVRPILGREIREGVRAIGSERPLYVLPRDAHLSGGAWDHDARLTWADLAWLRSTTKLPIVLKGIMTAEDAALAVEHGVDAVIVSNHGGRSLDTPRGTLDALPEVVEAAGSHLEVYVDGGIRTGHDVVVALALGARATLIGRPVTWGLAAGGAEGLGAVLEILRSQLRGVMGIVGAPTLADIRRTHVTERR